MPAASLIAGRMAASNITAGIEVPRVAKAPSAFNVKGAPSSARKKRLFSEKNGFEKFVVNQTMDRCKLSVKRFASRLVRRMGD